MKKITYLVSVFVLALLVFATVAFAERENNQGSNDYKKELKGLVDFRKEKTNKEEAKELGSTYEVHFFNDGKVLVRGAKVTSVSGNTINATSAWGTVVLNWAVDTTNTSSFIRRYGGQSNISEVAVGDYLSFEGALVTTSTSPIGVSAKVLKNWSVQKKNAVFEGTVKSVDSGASKFVLTTEKSGDITVVTNANTKFKKGNAVGAFADVVVGAKAMARGVYNNQLLQLTAEEVRVRVPETQSVVKEGTIKSIAGTTAPTSMVVTIGGTDYTVNVATTTAVLNNSWVAVALSTYQVGNSVVVHGPVNGTVIDATVLKNKSL